MSRTPAPPILSAEQLAHFADLVANRFGHQPDERRDVRIRDVLTARMRHTGAGDYEQYRGGLEPQAPEWDELASLLTVPETYFYRMPEHFDALVENAMPRLIDMRRNLRSLRLLSAGCATGEEPYTLRMVLSERVPEIADWQVSITGVDLSATVLERARAGVYSEWSLRATEEPRRKRWFTRAGKEFLLNPAARTGVTFRQENLLSPPVAGEPLYDVIFCRNVLIYFTPEAIRVAIANLTARLAPGGYLFLGPAESLRGITRNFHLCHAAESFFYRRKEETDQSAGAENAFAHQAGASWVETIGNSSARLSTLMRDRPLKPQAKVVPARVPAPIPVPLVPVRFLDLVRAERFADALAELERTPALPSFGVPDLDRSLLRASMLANLGRYAEAEAECRSLLVADELNPGTHYLLGLCHEQAGRLDEAEEQMCTASYLDPGFAMPHLHRGLIARRQGKLEAAQKAFGHAIEALKTDNAERVALFGGGFSLEGLRKLCEGELSRLKGMRANAPAEVLA